MGEPNIVVLILFGLVILLLPFCSRCWPYFLERYYSSTPSERAWKLLQELLTDEQKEQASKDRKIVERGKVGLYTIPLYSGYIDFVPFPTNLSSFAYLVRCWDADFFKFASKKGRICLTRTAENGPWYDAVATFILFIRSGNEIELFRRGNWLDPPVY